VEGNLIANLAQTFANLRRYRWKINLEKCVFGIPSGKLLGIMVSHQGIEVNPPRSTPSEDEETYREQRRHEAHLHDGRSRTLYTLLVISRKFRHYFQSHKIKVISSFPLGEILRSHDTTRRIVKWSVELGEFELEFCPRQAIKSQILADFVSECTETQQPPMTEKPEHWKMYFDGSLNLKGAGAGVLYISPQGDHLKYVLQIHYKASNNGAEYKALIHGLCITVTLGIKQLVS
jgi:hypothetical protein